MAEIAGRTDEEWARVIAQAYAEETKPPLTETLTRRVRDLVAEAIRDCDLFDQVCADRVNERLDAFEKDLDAAAGPRIVSIDKQSKAVTVKHRSEAGHPTRAFGGQ